MTGTSQSRFAQDSWAALPNYGWLAGLPDGQPRYSLYGAIAVHVILLAAMLRSPSPTFVKYSSVVAGNHGTAVTEIYWPHQFDDRTKDSAATHNPDSKEPETNPTRLEFRRPRREKRPVEIAQAKSAEEAKGGPQAEHVGSPLGSLSYGSPFGLEVRPAYPIQGADPIAEPGELPSGFEGDVIVEVTIDEQGNIVSKSVIQGINAVLDSKSLAALANWRFRPATKNGVPIASKHDVYFHFKSR